MPSVQKYYRGKVSPSPGEPADGTERDAETSRGVGEHVSGFGGSRLRAASLDTRSNAPGTTRTVVSSFQRWAVTYEKACQELSCSSPCGTSFRARPSAGHSAQPDYHGIPLVEIDPDVLHWLHLLCGAEGCHPRRESVVSAHMIPLRREYSLFHPIEPLELYYSRSVSFVTSDSNRDPNRRGGSQRLSRSRRAAGRMSPMSSGPRARNPHGSSEGIKAEGKKECLAYLGKDLR